MTIIWAKVIDNFHLELEDELHAENKEILKKIVDNTPISSLRGAWRYDVGNADFVDKMRRSKQIEIL